MLHSVISKVVSWNLPSVCWDSSVCQVFCCWSITEEEKQENREQQQWCGAAVGLMSSDGFKDVAAFRLRSILLLLLLILTTVPLIIPLFMAFCRFYDLNFRSYKNNTICFYCVFTSLSYRTGNIWQCQIKLNIKWRSHDRCRTVQRRTGRGDKQVNNLLNKVCYK